MEYEGLIVEKKEGILTLTLNRPEKLNALTAGMREGLLEVIEGVSRDDAVRALIVTGAGRGFCPGVDVGSSLGKSADEGAERTFLRPPSPLILPLLRLEKPTIAAINGVAAGAGVSLALACDIRIASDNARFTLAFGRRGLIPDGGLTYFLPRILGVARALRLIYTDDMLDARDAERIGLVSEVVPHEDLMGTTKELAERIAKGPPIAAALAKRAVYRGIANDLETQLYFESYAQDICMKTSDHQEGIKAFVEKREPVFKGE